MTTFNEYVEALRDFQEQNGHTRVPSGYEHLTENLALEMPIRKVALGYWVSYIRSRQRAGLLDQERVAQINEQVPGFEWGPLKPGPRPGGSKNRDNEIKAFRQGGMSLQKIGERYGLTRQRIHQLIKNS
jgi:hypothetical protein